MSCVLGHLSLEGSDQHRATQSICRSFAVWHCKLKGMLPSENLTISSGLRKEKGKDDAIRQFCTEKLKVHPSFPMAVRPSWVMQLWGGAYPTPNPFLSMLLSIQHQCRQIMHHQNLHNVELGSTFRWILRVLCLSTTVGVTTHNGAGLQRHCLAILDGICIGYRPAQFGLLVRYIYF